MQPSLSIHRSDLLRVVALCTCVWLAGCSKPDPAKQQTPVAFVPDSPQLIEKHNMGVALMGRFDYDKAHDVFADLVKAHPTWREAMIDLAIATLNRQREGDSQAALALLTQVIEAEPDNLRAHYCAGLLKLHGGQPAEALKNFDKVATADKGDAFAAYYVGQCRFDADQFEEALKQFARSIKLDPYQRSAYYGAFQAHQRQGHLSEAKEMLAQFEKLKDNPQARLAEFKYTRMGPLGEVKAVNVATPQAADHPKGDVFLEPITLPLVNGDGLVWATYGEKERVPSITACDMDGDGKLDLFITGAIIASEKKLNAVLLQRDGGKFEAVLNHPLAQVSEVNAVLWGDYDNDGLTDAYLLRKGPNQLWRQAKPSEWLNVTDTTMTAGENLDSIDGAIFDADHDGDLDLFVVNHDGFNELFNNNLDGTFKPIAKERGIAGDGKPSLQVVVADFDGDRDADILVVKAAQHHELWINDRLWNYTRGEVTGEKNLLAATITSIVMGDGDADGVVDGIAIGGALMHRFHHVAGRGFVISDSQTCGNEGSLAIADVDGDGAYEVILPTGPSAAWSLAPLNAKGPAAITTIDDEKRRATRWSVFNLNHAAGPAIIGLHSGKAPSIWRAGPGRFPFASLAFTGKEDKGDQLRSNRSGIGVRGAARIGTHWTAFDTFRQSSGPGQSLEPIAIGLAGAKQIDFISMTWPDGVHQTEMQLDARKPQVITETQRQLSSCPVIYVWDGTKFEFVTDCLGVGGIGFNIGNGEYGPPRPWENVMIPAGMMQPRKDADGGLRHIIKLGEPMEEACYLDAARLIAYDLPAGWKMTLDERFAIADPQPTGKPLYYRRELLPVKAMNEREADVTKLVTARDLQAAPTGKADARFIGRTEEFAVTLAFEQDIATWAAQTQSESQLVLLADGWVEYPYSQTMFAAWQAKADYAAPTLEAQDADGKWHMIIEQFGYPAGMPRQMSLPVPLGKLPKGARALRIRTNVEVYWDRLSLVMTEPCPQAQRIELPLLVASVGEVGFAHRTTGPQKQPHYDYQRRSSLWDTRHQSGWYTAIGSCTELLRAVDDAAAIIGPGEEVHLEFDAMKLAAPAAGITRVFVLETNGWCKDMDLYTQDGDTLEPLPKRDGSDAAAIEKRDALHRQYNTRYRSGR